MTDMRLASISIGNMRAKEYKNIQYMSPKISNTKYLSTGPQIRKVKPYNRNNGLNLFFRNKSECEGEFVKIRNYVRLNQN